jgi:hypothetical protein
MDIGGTICDSANTCQQIILKVSDLSADYDYVHISQVWGIGFSSVLGLWLVSYCLGTIVKAVRNS